MNKKVTINYFKKAKQEQQKLTMLTAYDYTMAQLIDKAGVDIILVGDSLGMVVQGNDNTLSVTVEDMIYHTKAVKRGVKRAFVLTDMPFMSYHISVEKAVENAGRIVKESGADAVKIEGGKNVVDKIEAIIKAQIPVFGHLGLTPQSVNKFGGFSVQGKQLEDARQIIEDAKLLQKAGVSAIVLEGIPKLLAKEITEQLTIPTIGIGAGKYCDGQVLVINDMLGMYSDFVPKFVKQYAHFDNDIHRAIKEYIDEVKKEIFPSDEYCYSIDNKILLKLKEKK
ncbi:MAG: 3-methyl-2-oxobutanoate hydroxymethyltransferase [Clostridiales bacterium]|nr:MAG: 3-methyl-2-oxobutanoate hydroxymethyltransferase [Clostridiales bacterium]